MKISANQLPAHLRSSLLPCYLVTGDEPLLLAEAVDALRARARTSGTESRELHVADTRFDWAELAASAGNLSLFSERRLIELRLPTGKPGKAGGDAIVRLTGQCGPELMLIVSAPKLDRAAAASAWVKAIDQHGAVVQVWPVGADELPRWIAARLERAGLAPDGEAVRLLADRVEGNLLAAQQEIDKLGLLVGTGPVTVADVEEAVADSSRFDVYKLVDAAVAGEAARALRILAGVHREGTDAVVVVWALTRELRTLARLADAMQSGASLSSAMQQAGVWRNRQSLVRACVGRHGARDFHRLLKLVRRADATAKGQQAGDPWALAAGIVVGLSSGTARAA